MKFCLISPKMLRKNPNHLSNSLILIQENEEIIILNKKIIYDGKIPFVKASYKGYVGYINARYLKGLVLKTYKTDSIKYPKKSVIANGTAKGLILKIPQQNKFNSFCKKHGCSVAAVTTALQLHNILLSPAEVWVFAKKFLSGYTGSKLTIFGTEKVINKKCPGKAQWEPFTGKNKLAVKEDIKKAVLNGYFVLFEQKNPIHTNTIIGRDIKGKYVIATNGTTKKVTLNYLVKKALVGYKSRNKQRNWFKGSQYGAGYVIVRK